MNFFKIATQDDSIRPGITIIRDYVGPMPKGKWVFPQGVDSSVTDSVDDGADEITLARYEADDKNWRAPLRFIGLRVVIVIPTPFRKLFNLDFNRRQHVYPINWWTRLDFFRFGLHEFCAGIGPRIAKEHTHA